MNAARQEEQASLSLSVPRLEFQPTQGHFQHGCVFPPLLREACFFKNRKAYRSSLYNIDQSYHLSVL